MPLTNNRGQSQILMVLVMGTAMFTSGLVALQLTEKVARKQIQQNQKSEMLQAINEGVQTVSELYRYEAGCDPVALNRVLARLRPDGSFGNDGTNGGRVLTRVVRNQAYRVTIGPVSYLNWTGTNPSQANRAAAEFAGTSQDAIVEVWTSREGQFRDDGTEFGTRLVQRAVLVNNCTYPCSVSPAANNRAQGVCNATIENNHAYHRIVDPAAFGNVPECIVGQRRMGNIDTNFCNDGALEDDIDPIDLTVLRNYILSGNQQGSCAAYVHGAVPGQFSIPCVDRNRVVCNDGASALQGCGDLNLDRSVDEVDLSILEKILRGYLHGAPLQ